MLSPDDRVPPHAAVSPPLPIASERAAEASSGVYRTKLVMVPFRSGEAVIRHPDICPLLEDGWKIKSATPRITTEGTKLLVVLGAFGPADGATPLSS